MNNNYDFDSQKYMIILVVICALFAIAVIKAFDFLPEEQKTQNVSIEEVNSTTQSDTSENTTSNNDISQENKEQSKNTESPKKKRGVLYSSNDTEWDDMSIQEIKAPKGVNEEITEIEDTKANESSDTFDYSFQSLLNGKKYKANGDYKNAIAEYKNVIEQTKNEEILAIAYEDMAGIYAAYKKYGTALSFANKANKLSPSVGREFLIAKIYYASGDTNTAINNINSLLKRSFNKN